MNEDYSNNYGGKNGDTDSDVTAALNNNNNNEIGYLVVKQYRNTFKSKRSICHFGYITIRNIIELLNYYTNILSKRVEYTSWAVKSFVLMHTHFYIC